MNKTGRALACASAMIAVLAVTAIASFQAGVHAQTPAPAPRVEKQVLDNAAFNIRSITYQPGYKQDPHTVAANRDEVLIQITPGKMQGMVDGVTTVGSPGYIWWTPKAPSQHAFANIGDTPVTFLVVQAKQGPT